MEREERKKIRVIKAHSVEELEDALVPLYADGLEVDCISHTIAPRESWPYMQAETWTALLTFKGVA